MARKQEDCMYSEAGTGIPACAAETTPSWAEAPDCSVQCRARGGCAVSTAHELAESLGRAVDARDRRLFHHSELVADLSSLLALTHGLTARQAQVVHMAGHLHDVGKIGVPDSILHKPGPLDAFEWALMQQHPRIGAEILRPVRVFCGRPGVCEIVLAHHERYDGTGYPNGLRGRDIPLGARIVAVADALSAMTEERPYRKGLSLAEALAEIKRCSGSHFDPLVVADLLSLQGALAMLMASAAERSAPTSAPEGARPGACAKYAAAG
jgi:HD-GYP domain-containing protein (c-di-GMP phosphodiesterase class II)